MDDFSGAATFVVACLLPGELYFSLQSILNDILLPAVERIFRKSQPLDSQPMEIATRTQLTLSEPTVTIPQYGDYKQTAQQKIQQDQEQILENVLAYTYRELALYIKEIQHTY